MHQAVSSHHFLNYGLVVRFRLLPTPPLGDAVPFSYGQPVNDGSVKTCTSTFL